MRTKTRPAQEGQGQKGYLLIPAPHNHFQTLQLFALAQKKGGHPFMLLTKTDESADNAIRKLAHQQGIPLIAPKDALAIHFERVYAHAWTYDPDFLESLHSDELHVYADGLSNRLRRDRLPEVSGYVFWGEEILKECDWSAVAPGLSIELVSAALIQSQWSLLAEVMKISTEELNDIVGSPDLVIAFRYWGSSIYFGLGLAETKGYISRAIQKASSSERIVVAPDFRWDLRVAQVDLVKEIATDSHVSELVFPKEIKKKLGHLCTLDFLAFNSRRIDYQVVAFDGSATLTFFLSSGSPNVPIVIEPMVDSVLPAGRLVSENISAYMEIIDNGRLSDATMLQLMQSDSLSEAIAIGSRALSEEERTLVVSRHMRDYRPPDNVATLALWLSSSSKRRNWSESVKRRLRSSKLARLIFYWGFTNSSVRKLIQVVKKVFL